MNWRVLIVVLLLPTLVWAQQPPVTPSDRDHPPVVATPEGDDKITPLGKGDKAPYEGQLFSVDTAIRWGNWLQQYKYRLFWDVQFEQGLCDAQLTYQKQVLSIEKKRAQQVEKSLRDALRATEKARLQAEEDARNPPWYSTTEFGVVVGAASAVGVMAIAIWALEARNP